MRGEPIHASRLPGSPAAGFALVVERALPDVVNIEAGTRPVLLLANRQGTTQFVVVEPL